MLLSASFFSIVREYIGILLFICLPVILLSAGLAIWLHYRQKKNKNKMDVAGDDVLDFSFSLTGEGQASQLVASSPLAMEDKIGLIKECREQLSKSRAKYVALKHDFIAIKKNIPVTNDINDIPENVSHMENLNEKITAYEKQINDLQNKLEVLETVVPVQDETYYLRQALREKDDETSLLKQKIAELENGNTAVTIAEETQTNNPIHNYATLYKRIEQLQEERAGFDKAIKEQGYLKDIYAESKLQVEFLQNQLELRIKNHSQAEQKVRELSSELNDISDKYKDLEGRINFLNQQVQSKQNELEQVQVKADQKDAELHRAKEELQMKNSQVSHLEGLLAEIKEQNSVLSISFGESQNAISILKEQLAGEQQHLHHAEDKLLKNRQLLERIYRDVESSIGIHEIPTAEQAAVKQMF